MSVIFHLHFTGVFAVFDSADGSHSEHSAPMTSMTTQTPGAFSSLATPSGPLSYALGLSTLTHVLGCIFQCHSFNFHLNYAVPCIRLVELP